MEGLCRGCLIRYDDPMDILQYTEKYRRLFVYSTGLQVKRNDRITFQVCKDCFLNMKAACKFKKLCRASDKKLRTYLTLKDVGDGVDLCTFLKNNDDTMAFRLPMTSGSSTPAYHSKLRDDDNESTCTSIQNFMTDLMDGEEMPDTEARIIREVIEEEADVLDDSLDSHWLQDDVSIDTDFRLDFSLSPFATPHAVNNDHCYTPKKLSEPKEQQLRKYFTSISPVRHTHRDVNDFTDVIRNNQSEKELCVLGTDEINKEITENNFDMPIIENENAENNFTVNNEKSISNLDLPIIEEEKSLNNLDIRSLPSLPSFDNEKSMNNLDLPVKDNEKSLNSLDLPSFDSEKSINNLDLPSLPSIDNERSLSNIYLLRDNDENQEERLNTPNFYVPTDGTTYITTSKELESIVSNKKLIKDKPCTIDKNLEKALENKDNNEFSLDELLVSPQVFHDASGSSTPTIKCILFGDKVSLNEKDLSKNLEHLGQNHLAASRASTPSISNILKDSSSKNSGYLDTNGEVDIEIFEELLQEHTKEIDAKDKKVISEIKHEFKVPMDVDEVDDKTTTQETVEKYKFSSEFDEGQFDLENFICNICDKKFESSKAICIHFVKKHKIKIVKKKNKDYKYKPRICNFCGKELRDLQNFHRHLKTHKKEKDVEVFKCDICNLDFTSQAKLEKHRNGHSSKPVKKGIGKYVCTICGATSTKIGNFRLHQRRHTKAYTHICQQCGKGFYRLSEFTVHMRIHTGEKPFPCIYCDKTFARKDALTKHVKYHMDNKRFKCEHCDKAFVDRSQLNLHMKIAVRCKVKRGILVDKKTLVQYSKAKPDEIEITKDSKEKEEKNREENDEIVSEDAVTELPYIDTELSN